MTDNQIIDEIILWAYDVHYPQIAPIGGWLRENYGCDEKRKWIIISKIERLGFAKLQSPSSGSDMNLTSYGLLAAESGSPCSYHTEQDARKSIPNIQGDYVVFNSGSISGTEINQGSNRREASPAPHSNSDTPAQKPKQKSIMWDVIPDWAKIIGGVGAISAAVKVMIELIAK